MSGASIDTGPLLAIASSRDERHQRALEIEERFRRGGGRFVGSTLVLHELHEHLSRHAGSGRAWEVVSALLTDPVFEWHDASVELLEAGRRQWIDRFSDQRLSLMHAVTFALMKRERLRRAFSFHDAFVTAGFELLD
jgi:predicted nucleic acid-binding protein